MTVVEPSTVRAPAALRWLTTVYFFSGITALSYEVLWARMLAVQFGVSIFGAAATVSAFLLGLGLGCHVAQRWSSTLSLARALRIFALLEGVIALYAMALPALHAQGEPGLEVLAQRLDWWQWIGLQVAVAGALLAVPAAAMGAGFPLVLRALGGTAREVGRLYGINCLGAAVGALFSLGLLASLGWSAALQVIAALGLALAAAALLLSRSTPDASPTRTCAPAGGSAPGGSILSAGRMLASYAGIGACALMLEIGWTRLYGLVLLRTEYVLAIILATYLLGTALGSLLAARAPKGNWPATAVPLVACGFTLIGLALLPTLAVWVQEQHFSSLASALVVQAALLCACTLPTTIALGAWFPLLSRRMGAAGTGDAHAAALLYSVNCLGAAIGAACTVLWIIPLWGTTACIALAAVALLILGWPSGATRAVWIALPVALAAAWYLRVQPPPQQLMPPTPALAQELFRYEDAVSLNHVVEARDGQRTLLTDLQHMDASSEPEAVQIQADQARLPLLLHRHPRSVLFLGLGTGISASGSLAWPDLQRTAVELSPGAIEAARTWFAPVNGAITQQMHIERDDARHYLAAHPQRFDVIIGDLFHPDLSGMSNLLSVEQFARARAHLENDGIFAQWIALNQFDRESLRIVLRSFQQAFPDAQMFLDGMHLALIGSPSALADAKAVALNLARMTPGQIAAATGKEGGATWLGRYWGPIAAGSGPVQSESRPVIEYRLPQLRYLDPPALPQILIDLLRQRPEAEVARTQLGVDAAQGTMFVNAYLANELAVESWIAQMQAQARLEVGLDGAPEIQRARQLTRLAYEANPSDHWIDNALADDLYASGAAQGGALGRTELERILRVFPDHVEALRALWHLEKRAGDAGAKALHARLMAVVPLDREARADLP